MVSVLAVPGVPSTDRLTVLRAVGDGRADNLAPVDAFEARRILRVFDALSATQQAAFAALDLDRMRAATLALGPLVELAR